MSLLLLWSLRASGVIVIGLLLNLLLRRRSAAVRNLVLRLTLLVAWALPLVALVAPRVEVPVAPPAVTLAPAVPSAPKVFSAPTPPITEGWSVVQPDPEDVSTLGVMRVTPFSTLYPTARPFLLLWGFGTGFLVLRWLVGFARLRRIAGRARSRKDGLSPRPPLQDEPLGEGEILFAGIAVPATYGRTILLPLEAEGWPEARFWAAIGHERAHVERRDWAWQTLGSLLCAVHWLNPLAWVLARSLRDTAESAADDAVLLSGLLPSAYARELLAVAATVGPTGPALAMARRGGVKDRIAAVLSSKRDRSLPTRRTILGIGALVLASGVALAGIALRDAGIGQTAKNDVRLVDIREIGPRPSARWNALGLPVATPTEVAEDPQLTLGITPKGLRRVDVRLAADGFAESDAPRETSLEDHFWIDADLPAKIVTYGSPHKDGQPVEGPNDGSLGLVLDAPMEATHARLHVRRASGPYRIAKVPKVVFTATSDTITWPEGTFPAATIAFRFPMILNDLDFRVVVVTSKGRIPVRDNEYEYADDEMSIPKAVYVPCDSPAEVQAVEFEVRDYVTATIDVPLRPTSPIASPSRAESKHTIRLVRISDDKSAWRPDGTPAKALGTIRSRYPAEPGQRKITLAFRVRGTTWSKPSLLVNVGEGYATAADWNLFMPVKDHPNERLGIATFNVPEALQTSPVTVVVEANPLRIDADQEPGPGAGHVKIERIKEEKGNDGKSWTEYRITLDGVAPLDPERRIDLSLLNGDGGFISQIVSVNATRKVPYYTVYADSAERIDRVVLRSRAVDRARFEGVHLRPNP